MYAYNFDPYNVFLAIATNTHTLLKTGCMVTYKESWTNLH